MMKDDERRIAELLLDRLSKIMTELKPAYDNAKYLANKYNWEMDCSDMSEAYINLSNKFIYIIMMMLEEDENGGEK